MQLFKIIILLTTIISFQLFASSKFELLATDITTVDNITNANGNVVVQGSNYYFQSNRATYDKKSEILELFGNVNIVKNQNIYTVGNYAKIDMKNDTKLLEPMFLLDDISGVWINSKSATIDKDNYILQQSTLSSCSTKDPFWSISFQNGDYSEKEQWINLYHSTFYFKDIPAFYLPYFGFPTDDTRRSGLLRPKISLNKSEGLAYIQPIYFTTDPKWDLEILPQIRTNRGQGLYTTFRFTDTKYSKGSITTGFFRDSQEWEKEYNLKNRIHNGIKIDYQNDKILSNKDSEDGLYLSVLKYNDVDFLNLEGLDSTSNTNPISTSKLNYYYNKDDYYFGLYAKYNYDSSSDSNSYTTQTLPVIQVHKSNSSIFTNKLIYSVDIKAKNYEKKSGLDAKQIEILTPISYSHNFFDDYLTLTISENLYTSFINYSSIYNFYDAKYLNNYHNIGINSMLVGKYDNFLHTIDISANYIIPSFESKDGDLYNITNTDEKLNFITFNDYTKSLNLSLVQFLNDYNANEILFHKMTQNIFYDEYNYKYGDLLNEFSYSISKQLKFYHESRYSHKNSNISKSSSTIEYKDFNGLTVKFNNTYTDEENLFDNHFSLLINQKINFKYSVNSDIYYNQHNDEITKMKIGYSMKKSCWEYRLDYIKDINPVLTDSGTNSIKNNKIYFEIELKPLGMGLSQYIEDI
jgi:LPS-assembly protein